MPQIAISSGRALKIAGIALLVAGGLLYAALGGPDDDPSGFLGVIVMIGGLLLHFRGRQQAAKFRAMGPESAVTDSKPDVLYLRSFSTDASTSFKILQSGLTTEEEQLADVLRPFGDLVAIGQPGEPLPIPGATRVYTKGLRVEECGARAHERAPARANPSQPLSTPRCRPRRARSAVRNYGRNCSRWSEVCFLSAVALALPWRLRQNRQSSWPRHRAQALQQSTESS